MRKESHKLAVKALIAESGLDVKHFDMAELMVMSFAEAKKEIARTKRVSESVSSKILKSIGTDVSAGHFAKFTESGDGEAGGKTNDEAFVSLN